MQLLDQTEYLHILLILHDGDEIKRIPDTYYNTVEIKPLNRHYAAKMLKAFDHQDDIFPNKSVQDLKKEKLFENKLSSYQIFEIFMLLKS